MPSIGTNSKPAYVYDAGTDTWIPIGPGEHTHDYAASAHNHDSTYIAKTLTSTTGDIIYASSANTPARLGIGSTNQVLTVSGGLPVWATPAGSGLVGCGLSLQANQGVTNNTWTAINFGGGELWDTDNFHDTSTNTSRMTIPTGKGGKYLVQGMVFFNSVVDNAIILALYKNGAIWNGGVRGYLNYIQDNTEFCSGDITVDVVAGDYLELFVYANSSGNETIDSRIFTITYLGA